MSPEATANALLMCRSCHKERAAADFAFTARYKPYLDRGNRDTQCRECRNEHSRALWHTRGQRAARRVQPEALPGSKHCTRCKVAKPFSGFSVSNANASGRACRCKDCEAASLRERRSVWAETPAVNRANKYCWDCKRIRPRNEYFTCRGERDGLYPICCECAAKRNLRAVLKARRITEAERDALLARQGNTCPICGAPLKKRSRATVIDHCHATGEVRGILCRVCNLHLGWMEQGGRIQKAIAYLESTA